MPKQSKTQTAEADPNQNSVEGGIEEGNQRAEVDKPAEATDEQAQAQEAQGQGADEATEAQRTSEEDEERQPTEIFEVKVNPALGIYAPSSVEIAGKVFFTDAARNRSEGTELLNDVEYEEISSAKEPESGKQYIVKK